MSRTKRPRGLLETYLSSPPLLPFHHIPKRTDTTTTFFQPGCVWGVFSHVLNHIRCHPLPSFAILHHPLPSVSRHFLPQETPCLASGHAYCGDSWLGWGIAGSMGGGTSETLVNTEDE